MLTPIRGWALLNRTIDYCVIGWEVPTPAPTPLVNAPLDFQSVFSKRNKEFIKNFHHHMADIIHAGMDVVEIGAGCGLAGLTAAALGARSVTLTDILSQQSHLQRNITLNRQSFHAACAVKCAVLSFGDQVLTYNLAQCEIHDHLDISDERGGKGEEGEAGEKGEEEGFERQSFDVVLGADIGYDLSLHQPIKETLSFLLQGPHKTSQEPSLGFPQLHRTTADLQPMKVPSKGAPEGTTPRVRIALLAEEVRWSDIHKWYLECLLDLARGQSEASGESFECPVYDNCGDTNNGDINSDGDCPGDMTDMKCIPRRIQYTTFFLVEKTAKHPETIENLGAVRDPARTKKSEEENSENNVIGKKNSEGADSSFYKNNLKNSLKETNNRPMPRNAIHLVNLTCEGFK